MKPLKIARSSIQRGALYILTFVVAMVVFPSLTYHELSGTFREAKAAEVEALLQERANLARQLILQASLSREQIFSFVSAPWTSRDMTSYQFFIDESVPSAGAVEDQVTPPDRGDGQVIVASRRIHEIGATLTARAELPRLLPKFRYQAARFAIYALLLLIAGTGLVRLIERQSLVIQRLKNERLEKEISRLSMFKDGLDAHFMLSVMDRSGQVLEVNDRFCDFVGLPRQEIVGRRFPDADHGIMTAISAGKAWQGVRRVGLAAGTSAWLDSTIVPISNPILSESYYVCIEADITDKQLYEERLLVEKKRAEEASTQKSLFLAQMSHEIRTPLASIVGYADLLSSHAFPDPETRGHVEKIKTNSKHLLSLIGGILDFSKIGAGQLEITRVSVPFLLELRKVTELFESNDKVKFIVRLIPPLPEIIQTDVLRLRQILMNLLNNAFKFTPEGHIQLTVRMATASSEKRGQLVFEISDTGIGFSKQDAVRLFQPFVQARDFHSRVGGGTGLGLALSKQLARALEGDLVLQRSTPGEGSVFLLTIDIGDLSSIRMLSRFPVESKAENGVMAAGLLSPTRILVVEDNDDMRRLVQLHLEAAGATVLQAESGEAALKLLEAERVDVVLLDIQLPRMSGYKVMTSIRSMGVDAPVLALTAHSTKTEMERCHAAGFSEFFSKPVDFPRLIASVHRWATEASTQSMIKSSFQPLYSTLVDDPLFRGEVQRFVAQIGEKVSLLEEFLRGDDWLELRSMAHQLKGSFGSYGYPELQILAAEIERLSHQETTSPDMKVKIAEHVASMNVLCLRAKLAFEFPEDLTTTH